MDELQLTTFGKICYEKGTKEDKVFKFITCGDLSGFDDKQDDK